MLHKIAKMVNQYLVSAAKRHELDITANDFHVEITVTAKTSGGQVIAITNDITVKDGLPTVYSETIRNEFGAVLKFVPGRAGNGSGAKKIAREMDQLAELAKVLNEKTYATVAEYLEPITPNENMMIGSVDDLQLTTLGLVVEEARKVGHMNVIAIDDLADFVEPVPAKKTRKKKAADAQEQ